MSVVLSTYNWSSVLPYAIRSALWQTYSNFELLVVGDGCTDDSADVVASFGDERIRWHNLASNSGNQSAPNNAGIELARGKYVAYLGQDDLWYPTHLALLVRAMERAAADVGGAITEAIGPPGSNIRRVGWRSLSGPGAAGVIPPSALMHRRTLVDEIGLWRDFRELRLPPDREFVLRAHAHGKRFATARALTVFKFPARYRPDCYRDKPFEQQARYMRRIETERTFVYRELLAGTFTRLFRREHEPELPERPPGPPPPGWEITQYRRIRGLE